MVILVLLLALAPVLLGASSPPGVAHLLNQVTGEHALVPTKKSDVWGCDLGVVTPHKGKLYMFFGDTFGFGSNATYKAHWRSNTCCEVAFVGGAQPRLTAVRWAVGEDGTAKALVQGAHDTTLKTEVSKIPSTAWSDNTNVYIWLFSVKGFYGDTWKCNNATIARSPDPLNAPFEHLPSPVWYAGSGFEMFAAVHVPENVTAGGPQCRLDPSMAYFFATPCGRLGPAKAARAPKSHVADQAAWEYLAGEEWVGNVSAATVVFGPSVGELTVFWSEALEVFVAQYTAPGSQVVARTSKCLEGDWGATVELFGPTTYTPVYGAFTIPQMEAGGWLHFVTSQWVPYNTWLARVNTSLLPPPG